MPVGFHPGGGLNPILNSPWFAFHILVSFGGYGCFTVGLAWSIAHLFDRSLDLNPAVPRRLALAGLLLLGHRHPDRFDVGRQLVGNLLELGPQGIVGAADVDG